MINNETPVIKERIEPGAHIEYNLKHRTSARIFLYKNYHFLTIMRKKYSVLRSSKIGVNLLLQSILLKKKNYTIFNLKSWR